NEGRECERANVDGRRVVLGVDGSNLEALLERRLRDVAKLFVVSAPAESHEAASIEGNRRNESMGVVEVRFEVLPRLVELVGLPERSATLRDKDATRGQAALAASIELLSEEDGSRA